MHNPNHGGARPGAGRPRKHENPRNAYIPGWLADYIRNTPDGLAKLQRFIQKELKQ